MDTAPNSPDSSGVLSGASSPVRVGFSELIDLANEAVNGKVLFASDDFFAGKENLIKSSTPVFIPGKYTENGKWMDGWESRRKRGFSVSAPDYCFIQLGLPGEIHGVNIDTSFFTGNYPEYASISGAELSPDLKGSALITALETTTWTPLLPKVALAGGTKNYFEIHSRHRFTHLRLNMFPDGGIARLRVHGVVRPSKELLTGTVDVASAALGAVVITANDMYFGPKDNLILPTEAKTMGEGWETRRKRGPGHDWLILRLAGAAAIQKLMIETKHFKGNFPNRCSVDVLTCAEQLLPCDFRDRKDLAWHPLLAESPLKANSEHIFEKELLSVPKGYHYLRLNIFPDGGVSRLRAWGTLL